MVAPDPTRQKQARQILREIVRDESNVFLIHYSCESFYEREDGRSPRITSIALRNLGSGQTDTFSIHQIAEINGVLLDDIEEDYDELEREMLERFFAHINQFQQMKYVHWNMRDSNYGFQALEHRYRVLHDDEVGLYIVDNRNKIDLSGLFIDMYGVSYVGHPRLERLVERNSISDRGFLPGAMEAQAFEDKEFVALHQSTLRKVDILSNIIKRTLDGNLKTNTNWWGMHGGGIRKCSKWLLTNAAWGSIGTAVGIAGIVLGIFL